MSAGKYNINSGYIFVGSHESTKEQAIKYAKKQGIKVKSCKISAAHKARVVYINSIRQARRNDGDLQDAAIIADSKGYNWTCDFQDEWYEAISLA